MNAIGVECNQRQFKKLCVKKLKLTVSGREKVYLEWACVLVVPLFVADLDGA